MLLDGTAFGSMHLGISSSFKMSSSHSSVLMLKSIVLDALE